MLIPLLEQQKAAELKEIRESLASKEKQFHQMFNNNNISTTSITTSSTTTSKQTSPKKVNFDLTKPKEEKRSHKFDRKNI